MPPPPLKIHIHPESQNVTLFGNRVSVDGMGFPRGWVVKNPPANAGDSGSILGLGKSPGGGNGNPLQYSCLENPMGRGSLVGYSPWGHKRVGHALAIEHSRRNKTNSYWITMGPESHDWCLHRKKTWDTEKKAMKTWSRDWSDAVTGKKLEGFLGAGEGKEGSSPRASGESWPANILILDLSINVRE